MPFTVQPVTSPFEFPASCTSDDSAPKDYDVFLIEYDDGSLGGMGVRTNKKNLMAGSRYEFTSGHECKDFPLITKASFKPVD